MVKSWDAEKMAKALELWRDSQKQPNKLSKRQVAEMFSIPTTTFRDYTNGQTLGASSGRVSALSESEEEGLVAGLIELDVLGFPATRLKLRTLVLKIVSDGRDHRFKATGPGDKLARQCCWL